MLLEAAANPPRSFNTSETSSKKYLALLGFLPTVQAKISGGIGRSGFVTVLNMLSNMSSSDLSSPIHITMSGGFPSSTIRCITFSTARPLLTPCINTKNRFDHIRWYEFLIDSQMQVKEKDYIDI